ncbi:MAG: LuxR C-terminal-related transcriptional regulator [Desulfobaccales bacterium]
MSLQLMPVPGYSDFSLQKGGAPFRTGSPFDTQMLAQFRLTGDVSHLFPYINAVADSPSLMEKPRFIRFVLEGVCCGLYPDHGKAGAFTDRDQALRFLDRLLAFLNDLCRRRDELQPNYKRWNPVPVLDIFRLLPRTNCRTCGYPSCLAFAAALSRQRTGPERCPGFLSPISTQAVYPVHDKFGNLMSTVTLELDPAPPGRKPVSAEPPRPRKNTATGEDYLAAPLTGRELEVLRLLVQGATNGEISGSLKISRHTVKSHVINIFNKLGVNDRTQAAVRALRHELI